MTDERTASIYALLDEQRRIRYVGQSENHEKRAQEHWRTRNTKDRIRRNPDLAAWLQGLPQAPGFHVFQSVSYARRHAAEAYWTELLGAVPGVGLLNVFTGATPGERTRAKLSERNRGRAPWIKGKSHTAESRAKMSAAQKGKTVSEETRSRMRAAQQARTHWPRGRKLTEEQRARIGDAHRGKTVTEQTREKISKANKGRRLTEEQRAKIASASKDRVFEEKWCDECQRSWSTRGLWGRHIRKYHEGGSW